MTGSERPSPEPLLNSSGKSQPYWGCGLLKNFALLDPPPPEKGPLTRKFFMFGGSFPFKIQEKPKQKEFFGGFLRGAQNSLCCNSLCVLFAP